MAAQQQFYFGAPTLCSGTDTMDVETENTTSDETPTDTAPFWLTNPRDLIDRRVSIRWQGNKYHKGTFRNFNDTSGKHLVVYDDGDRRYYHMADKIFKVDGDPSGVTYKPWTSGDEAPPPDDRASPSVNRKAGGGGVAVDTVRLAPEVVDEPSRGEGGGGGRPAPASTSQVKTAPDTEPGAFATIDYASVAQQRRDAEVDARFTVRISQADLDRIKAFTSEYTSLETGGDLWGEWQPDGNCIVTAITGPGQGAKRSSVSWNQSEEYLVAAGEYLKPFRRYNIGTWHSHHTIGLKEPSGGDSRTCVNAIENYGRGYFLAFITTIETEYEGGYGSSLFGRNGQQKVVVRPYIYQRGHGAQHHQGRLVVDGSPSWSDEFEQLEQIRLNLRGGLAPPRHDLVESPAVPAAASPAAAAVTDARHEKPWYSQGQNGQFLNSVRVLYQQSKDIHDVKCRSFPSGTFFIAFTVDDTPFALRFDAGGSIFKAYMFDGDNQQADEEPIHFEKLEQVSRSYGKGTREQILGRKRHISMLLKRCRAVIATKVPAAGVGTGTWGSSYSGSSYGASEGLYRDHHPTTNRSTGYITGYGAGAYRPRDARSWYY